jgi:NifU-like protein involved in Fe-S cluster formation
MAYIIGDGKFAKPIFFGRRRPGEERVACRYRSAYISTDISHRQTAMLDDIYNKRILGFAGSIPRLGRLESPDATATAHSRLCGSTVTVDLKMDDDVVTDFAHEVKACALGQASSSIMAQHVVGAHADELRQVRETMLKMLKENGSPPEGRFEDLKFLEPVRDYKARHASTMLTFDAVVDAIDQIEAKRAAAS